MAKIGNGMIEGLLNARLFTALVDTRSPLLPVSEKFKIHKLNSRLKPIMKAFITSKRELQMRYCEKDGKGKPVLTDNSNRYSFFGDNVLKFNAEFQSLLNQETEVSDK